MARGKLDCPSCGQIDRVEKVSSIVAGGITTGKSRGWGGIIGVGANGDLSVDGLASFQGSTVSSTMLARKLAPPREPRSPKTILTGLIVASVLLGFFAVAGFADFISARDTAGFTVFLVFAGILAVVWFFGNRAMIAAQHDIEDYNRIISSWKNLYYCVRCDVVFDPRNARYVSSDRMARLC